MATEASSIAAIQSAATVASAVGTAIAGSGINAQDKAQIIVTAYASAIEEAYKRR